MKLKHVGMIVVFNLKVAIRHLKLKQGVCGMATHTRAIHQCESHY